MQGRSGSYSPGGPSFTRRDKAGFTALGYAIARGHPEVARLLEHAGAKQ